MQTIDEIFAESKARMDAIYAEAERESDKRLAEAKADLDRVLLRVFLSIMAILTAAVSALAHLLR